MVKIGRECLKSSLACNAIFCSGIRYIHLADSPTGYDNRFVNGVSMTFGSLIR